MGSRLGHAEAFPKRSKLRSVSFPIQRTRVTRVTRDIFFHLRSFALFSVSKYSLDDNQDDNIIIIIKVFFRDVAIRRF